MPVFHVERKHVVLDMHRHIVHTIGVVFGNGGTEMNDWDTGYMPDQPDLEDPPTDWATDPYNDWDDGYAEDWDL